MSERSAITTTGEVKLKPWVHAGLLVVFAALSAAAYWMDRNGLPLGRISEGHSVASFLYILFMAAAGYEVIALAIQFTHPVIGTGRPAKSRCSPSFIRVVIDPRRHLRPDLCDRRARRKSARCSARWPACSWASPSRRRSAAWRRGRSSRSSGRSASATASFSRRSTCSATCSTSASCTPRSTRSAARSARRRRSGGASSSRTRCSSARWRSTTRPSSWRRTSSTRWSSG